MGAGTPRRPFRSVLSVPILTIVPRALVEAPASCRLDPLMSDSSTEKDQSDSGWVPPPDSDLLDWRAGLAALLGAALALLIGAAAPGVAQAKSGGAFATESKIDQVRVRCAHTGPQKGLVRVDAEVRHADVRREKRFRDHHLIVRAKVKLRKDNGTRLATMRGRGKLRTALKGKTTAHRYHAYLSKGASKRVLRYACLLYTSPSPRDRS